MLNFLIKDVPKRLQWIRANDPIPEELRGWNYLSIPVRPRAYFGLGVSEVAYRYCDTFRDLWLRRRENLKGEVPDGSVLNKGKIMHALLNNAFRDGLDIFRSARNPSKAMELALQLSRKRAKEPGNGLYGKAADFYLTWILSFITTLWLQQSSSGDELSYFAVKTEFVVDGSPLGLSNQLRIDAYHESGVIIEYKLGNGEQENVERYAPGLAGYALSLEASLGMPVEYGALVFISDITSRPNVKVSPVYISPYYRRLFLENRDEAIEVLMRATPPPKASSCSQSCPYYRYCNQR
jgi:CRISPR-associated protein Csa1